MEAIGNKTGRDDPERLIFGLVEKLRHHALWDALLIFSPPVAAACYCIFYLFIDAWIGLAAAAALAAAALSLGTLAMVLRYRPNVPSVPFAARLIDDRGRAQDRFLTLATLSSSTAAVPLLSRLRAEARGIQKRIAIRREFPYRIKRQVLLSLLLSLTVPLLFHLFMPFAHSTFLPRSAHERLRQLATRMAELPGLQAASSSLQNLVRKLADPKVPPQEEQNSIQEERKKIEELAKHEAQKQNRDLLKQAAGTLQGLEQSDGEERKKNQNGSGGIQSNLQQQGGKKGPQGSGGEGKGERGAQTDNGTQQGKLAQGSSKDGGKESNAGNKPGGAAERFDRNNPGKDQKTEGATKTNDAKEEGTGRSKASEEIPQAAPPQDRMRKPGEGKYQGIKGAGYVTVQLPEAIAAGGKGAGQKKDSKGGTATSSQVPVSNVPLPKHMPEAPAEKQPMPLEYRGIIR